MKSIVGATVIVTDSLVKLVQPLAVQVAVYEVVIVGLTEILVPVKLLLHITFPAHPLAVNVAFCPLQILVLPTKTGGFIVKTFKIIILLFALVPHEFEQFAL